MNRLGFGAMIVFLALLAFFFPKGAGLHGNVPITEEHSCDCLGYKQMNKISGAYIYTAKCFGVPHDCSSALDCKEGEPCWLKERGCRCPGTNFWADTDHPCKDDDNCVCSHNECETGNIIGG